jgi:hypothetical protein
VDVLQGPEAQGVYQPVMGLGAGMLAIHDSIFLSY